MNAGLRTWNWRLPLAFAAGVALLLGLGVWFFGPTMGEPVLATVVGNVTLERIGQPSPITATAGTRLQPGDVLLTATNATAAITFGTERTRFDLGAETALTLTSLAGGKRFDLRSGRLEAEVARQRPFAPLVVTTPNAAAMVIGTRFTLTAMTNRTRLDVAEGTVRLADTAGTNARPVKVSAGNYAVVAAATELAALPLTGSISFQGWSASPGVNDVRTHPNYPAHPDLREAASSLEMPTTVTNTFGARLVGYLHPPQTGDYVFWLAAEPDGVFYLSESESPDEVRTISQSASKGGPREWLDRRPDGGNALTRSAAIRLGRGRRYYIELIQPRSGPNAHLAIAWTLPDGRRELIRGEHLSPLVPGSRKENR